MNHDKAWRHTCKVFLISLFWEALDIRALMCQVTCQIVTKLFLEDNGIWSLILVSNIFFSLNNVKGVLCSHQEAVLLDLWQLLHLSCSSSNAFFCLNYYYPGFLRNVTLPAAPAYRVQIPALIMYETLGVLLNLSTLSSFI